MDRRRGEDPRQRRAAAEARQAGCATPAAVAGGWPLSADLDSFERREGPAAVADSLPQAGASSRTGEERTATPGAQSGRAEEKASVERSGAEVAAPAAAEAVVRPATRRPAEADDHARRADEAPR